VPGCDVNISGQLVRMSLLCVFAQYNNDASPLYI